MGRLRTIAAIAAAGMLLATPANAVKIGNEEICPYRLICITPEDEQMLYTTVYMEAGGESMDGMRAVAQVILNRVLDSGTDVESVISRAGQFAVYPMCRQTHYSQEAKQATDEVLMGENLVLDYETTYFSQSIVPGTEYVMTLGGHTFSKEK